METGLPNATSSAEEIQCEHGGRNYDLPPAYSKDTFLIVDISETLLQDDMSILHPSSGDRGMSTMHHWPQEDPHSSEEELPLMQDSSKQEVSTLLDQSEQASEPSTALFQELSHAEAGQNTRKHMLEPQWKEIITRNWLSKAISICITVIQQVIMLQLGIVTATIASLALESEDVAIGDVASVSIVRATAASTGAFVMAWQYLSRGSFRSAWRSRSFLLILLAALLWCLSQFLLLIILTDVSLRPTAGHGSTVHLPFNLRYSVYPNRFIASSTGAWHRKISNYASFAEYSEPPYEADGVSDTGPTLRAFLPFATAQERENLESYKGFSTVLDARVTCQVPQIQNATVDSRLRFQGSVAPTRITPRLSGAILDSGSRADSPGAKGVGPGLSKDFDCVPKWLSSEESSRSSALLDSVGAPKKPPQWEISLCRLWAGSWDAVETRFHGLVSEFRDSSQMGRILNGATYLLLNNTSGSVEELSNETGVPDVRVIAEASRERDEWLNLVFANGSVILSASICYAAFDLADMDVRISSQSNRTESRAEPVFNRDTYAYTFQELRHAMGQDRSLTGHKRGIMELEKGTWQLVPRENYIGYQDVGWALRETVDLAYTGGMTTPLSDMNNSTVTALLSLPGSCRDSDCVIPESMHVSILPRFLLLLWSWAAPVVAFKLRSLVGSIS